MDEKYHCLQKFLKSNLSRSPNTNANLKINIPEDQLAPISLEYDEISGRYLVASRDISKGEVIFWEVPLVIAPKCGYGPSCLNCFTLFSEEDWPCCKGCGLPVCFPVCEGIYHSQEECHLLSQLQAIDKSNGNFLKQLNIALTSLRSWFQSSRNEDLYKSLENSLDKRKSGYMESFVETYIVNFIHQRFSLLNIPAEFIRMMCGIFDTNAFEVTIANKRARALLPAAALMNHSCIPNTQHWFKNGQCVVRASVNITRGDQITNNYTQTLWATKTRRQHLLTTKYFRCECSRCEDLTENGTNLGNLVCTKCKKGYITPCNETEWQCCTCQCKMSSKQITAWISVALSIASNSGKMDAESLLRAITTFDGSLGQQYYITLELKMAYVKMIASNVTTESMESLLRVIFMCQFILTIIEKIDPGYSRLRGLLLFYKSKAFIEALLRLKEKCNIEDFPELKTLVEQFFDDFIDDSEECVKIMKYDSVIESSIEMSKHLSNLRNDFIKS